MSSKHDWEKMIGETEESTGAARASFHTMPGTGKKTLGGAGAHIPVRLCPVSRVCAGSPGVLLPVRFHVQRHRVEPGFVTV